MVAMKEDQAVKNYILDTATHHKFLKSYSEGNAVYDFRWINKQLTNVNKQLTNIKEVHLLSFIISYTISMPNPIDRQLCEHKVTKSNLSPLF